MAICWQVWRTYHSPYLAGNHICLQYPARALSVLAHGETTPQYSVQKEVVSHPNQVGCPSLDIDLASLLFRQRGKHAINQVINLFCQWEECPLYHTEPSLLLDTIWQRPTSGGQGLDAWYKSCQFVESIGFVPATPLLNKSSRDSQSVRLSQNLVSVFCLKLSGWVAHERQPQSSAWQKPHSASHFERTVPCKPNLRKLLVPLNLYFISFC